ncbi:MAG: hypothetical protein N4A70_11015 [Pelagimonas sp.]|jgi:hypothetical protein|nr:hypothetical protein [Pelagimonas sp.]
MQKNDVLEVMTRQLASANLPKKSLEKLAKVASRSKHKPIGMDICKYGICLDLLVDGGLDQFDLKDVAELEVGRIRDIEIFPWGIIRPDLLRVRVSQEL